jgi:hypothetical protein
MTSEIKSPAKKQKIEISSPIVILKISHIYTFKGPKAIFTWL